MISIGRACFPRVYFHASSAILLNLIKMNSNLNNLFAKYLKGASMGSFLLVGLGYLALNSYYYGTPPPRQSTWATTPSSSISSSDSPRRSTARATT